MKGYMVVGFLGVETSFLSTTSSIFRINRLFLWVTCIYFYIHTIRQYINVRLIYITDRHKGNICH